MYLFYIKDQKQRVQVLGRFTVPPKHESYFNRLHIELAFSLPREKIQGISFDFPGAISLADFDIHVVEGCLEGCFQGLLKLQE